MEINEIILNQTVDLIISIKKEIGIEVDVEMSDIVVCVLGYIEEQLLNKDNHIYKNEI